MVIKGKLPVVRWCPHRGGVHVVYIVNDNISPPVIYVRNLHDDACITLMNQTVKVSCPSCFQAIQQAAQIS
jgi:hypothetical protein